MLCPECTHLALLGEQMLGPLSDRWVLGKVPKEKALRLCVRSLTQNSFRIAILRSPFSNTAPHPASYRTVMYNLMHCHAWHLGGHAHAYLTTRSRGSTKINPAAVDHSARSPQCHVSARNNVIFCVPGRTHSKDCILKPVISTERWCEARFAATYSKRCSPSHRSFSPRRG